MTRLSFLRQRFANSVMKLQVDQTLPLRCLPASAYENKRRTPERPLGSPSSKLFLAKPEGSTDDPMLEGLLAKIQHLNTLTRKGVRFNDSQSFVSDNSN